MVPRYANSNIDAIWSNANKLALWQRVELAVIEAMTRVGKAPDSAADEIWEILQANPIDEQWWLKRDSEIHHDLNAFLEERLRFIPAHLQQYFHKNITSYDTEEPAFALMLQASMAAVWPAIESLETIIAALARQYRYTPMYGKTHGQGGEMISFGKRCLSWLQDLKESRSNLNRAAAQSLDFSKLSGAMGNYGGLDPQIEKFALEILGFKPYYGATQIMPRELYAPLAQALSQVVQTIEKIALAIRLGARSGLPIYQEPFAKIQKGSSAMPHKKNTIRTENVAGMARLATASAAALTANIETWEERAIEQSSVERVAWPDLFHVTLNALKGMNGVLSGLRVYPDHMIRELQQSRGCYASAEAKDLLKELGEPYGLTVEDAYRIVQLAAFNVHSASSPALFIRQNPPASMKSADDSLAHQFEGDFDIRLHLRPWIQKGLLRVSAELEATGEQVNEWNDLLNRIFLGNPDNIVRWQEIFQPSFLLRNEAVLYREILEE